MPLDQDLPDDVRALIAPHLEENIEMLDAIGVAIAARRDEAKTARASSGIEDVWRACEEAYLGIDEANRHEFAGAKWSKPVSMEGPVTTDRAPAAPGHKSTVFVRLTPRYVDAGAAKLGEILLPPDDKAFSFAETPIPALIKAKEDNSHVVLDHMGNAPAMRALKPGETPPAAPIPTGPGAAAGPPAPAAPAPVAAPAVGAVLPAGAVAPPPPPQVPLRVRDLAEEKIEIARKKAKAAEERIYDWMVECQYTAEVRKVIFDAARVGVGVLKAPFPKSSRVMAMRESKAGGLELQIEDKISPAAKWVDYVNIFPDPACGENIHLGDFVFERDYLSERQVRDLKKIPGYIATQIDRVIEEGPDKAYKNSSEIEGAAVTKREGRYEVWYFYGTLKRDEMGCLYAAAGKPLTNADVPAQKTQVYAIVTLVNECVIRTTINPLDSGAFPYHSVPWQRRAGHWAGVGIAEQITTPQKMLNAATRAMLNNAGKSAGSQIVVDRAGIAPADGQWTMTPDKVWWRTGDAVGNDVRQNFMAVEIPNVTKELMQIVNYALELAEQSTSIPLITQGQSGPTTPDTFGAAQLQNNNANQLLRSIGYAFDDYLTEPVVRQFYEWLLLDPDVPDEEKGDFQINAHGSAALVERAIQDQTVAQMGPLVVNAAYGIDPKKWAKEFLKSKRLDPAAFVYTEEEQAKMDAAPPPAAPAVQVAQIAAETAKLELAAKQSADQRSTDNEMQIAQAAHALEGQGIQVDATVRLHELEVKRQLALLDYANAQKISLNQAQTALAKTALTINTEKQLNAENNAIALHKHNNPSPQPPVQVPGRAANGHAFDQSAVQ